MKATLHFDLPEEQEEYEIYSKAMLYKIALEDIMNNLRNKIKYEDAGADQNFLTLQQEFFDIINSYSLEI